ncbi:Protein Ves [Paraburkholderia aspalathi]|uniref:HutD/Ves family protein n=1 Tax=Paraburkholderia aspalathi TaxID=1324617 RepID=UPI00190DA9EB|nr:HutD family protein [Paraburkholderia aspalathi]MBK3843979.1 HutD family protein [Paraburkholderia aspalathi]CAE6864710.1 Protein Ves [Paraburkholderia aspalathi]CAE6872885.1 Protein Ves [Paraburkholderia aspalathi]
MASVSLIRGADLVASPWKNGGGVMREVAAFPEGAALDVFVWRVSVADVTQAGPFSRFAGIDRTLVLLSGARMLLVEAGGPHVVVHTLREPLDIARFEGEMAIVAHPVDGPTRDFNLMVRRSSARADLTVWRSGAFDVQDADTLLLFCAHGPVDVELGVGAMHTLDTLDTLRVDSPRSLSCKLRGEGAAMLAVRLHKLPTDEVVT